MKTFALLVSLVLGGTVVDQGLPGAQPWKVNCTNCSGGAGGGSLSGGGISGLDGGAVPVNGLDGGAVQVEMYARPCRVIFTDGGSPHQTTSVGTTAVSMPATNGRVYISLTNNPRNTGMPGVTCRCDGLTPDASVLSAGSTLYPGDTVTCPVAADAGVQCISDTATTYTTSFECVPL